MQNVFIDDFDQVCLWLKFSQYVIFYSMQTHRRCEEDVTVCEWISKCEDRGQFHLYIERYKTFEWITLRFCQVTKPVLYKCYIVTKNIFCNSSYFLLYCIVYFIWFRIDTKTITNKKNIYIIIIMH